MTVQLTQLENGLRIITHDMPQLQTVSLGVWVGTGARHERDDQHGIAHLLEHMAFKGTPRRSAREIAEAIENVGGDLNAATSLETTAYYARVLKDDVSLALDIISDILLNPLFDPQELQREQAVILQEIAASEDSPDDQVYDLAQAAAYPKQPLGRTILGTPESITRLTPDDLRDYLATHYTAGRLVIAAAGAVSHDRFVAEAEQYFAAFKPRPAPPLQAADYVGGEAHSSRPFEQSHLLLGFDGPSYREKSYYAAQVLSSLLGGGMSSRLFQEVREKRGLCYAIYSFCWGLSDSGMFGIHAASGAEQMDQLAEMALGELRILAEKGPLEQEVRRAKAQLKASLLMSLESSSARAEQMARQVLVYGRPLEIAELVDKVEAVSVEAVREIAAKILTHAPLTLSTAGDKGPLRSYDRLRALCA